MGHVDGLLDDAAHDPRWGAFCVVVDGRLVANAGFFGPPDVSGEAEIGYSVCLVARRRGIATAIVAELCRRAAELGCASVRAHTREDNAGSVGALVRNGFTMADTGGVGDQRVLVLRRSTSGG